VPSPVEAEKYIRFQLEHLTAQNEHHTFEEICYRIAKRRLSSNILPATGPVSAGGDQGRDAETYYTRLPEELPGTAGFVGRATTEPLVMACSVQKDRLEEKVRGDLNSICRKGGKVNAVAFFAVQEIPVAARHRLQEHARERHGMTLEIFDGHAISHMLAEADLVWVAERYLDLPSHLVPDSPDEPQPGWYEHTLAALRQRGAVRLTPGAFSEIRDGLRHATFDDAARADLPEWLDYMREFTTAESDAVLAVRARYECTVATLRGLNTLEGAEGDIRAVLDYAIGSRLTSAPRGRKRLAHVLGRRMGAAHRDSCRPGTPRAEPGAPRTSARADRRDRRVQASQPHGTAAGCRHAPVPASSLAGSAQAPGRNAGAAPRSHLAPSRTGGRRRNDRLGPGRAARRR